MLVLHNSSKAIPQTSKLGQLLKLTKALSIENELLVMYTREVNTGVLTIKIPQFDESEENSLVVLSSLIELACVLHGVKPQKCFLVVDEKLDRTPLVISGTLSSFVKKLIASAKSPYGHFDGPPVQLREESPFKGTPPALLAAMRLLSMKDGLLRKISFQKGSKRTAVTCFRLQELFNSFVGLKADNSSSFTLRLFKAIMASCIKPYNKGFPGGYSHAMRSGNNVKNSNAVLTKLGWVTKVPPQLMINEVVFNTVDLSFAEVEGKKKVVGRSLQNISSKKRNFSFQEFRAACAMTLRKLDINSQEGFDTQLKKDSLDPQLETVISNFSTNEAMTAVNALQQSYAFKVTIGAKGSKTTLTHYENSRNKFLGLTSNMKLVTGNGSEFDTFSSLPEGVQNYLRKKFRYPLKRAREPEEVVASTSQEDVDMAVEDDQTIQLKRQKKRRS
jgi:hypothetical protein